MPYIPQFNKLSLNEMSYAPTLMRQQEDELVTKQMELADALKFDYLKQDAPGIEPVLSKYNKDIDDLSKQIAQQGFSHDIKSKVLGLRNKYITDDKIRTYKKNYSDAMTQWEDLKKRMIQEGRPGDDINRQKQAFFSGYSGAYDNEAFKQEFTPGRTSGYYDIAEDAKRAMTNIGETGRIVGSNGAGVEYVTNPKTGLGYYRVTGSKPGQEITNDKQIDAVANYLKFQYGNENTDRGLYSRISGHDQNSINSIIDSVAASMTQNRYAQLPQNDINITGIEKLGANRGQNAPRWNPSQYQEIEGVVNSIEEGDKKLSKVLSGIDPNTGMFNPDLIKEDSGTLSKIKREALKQTDFYIDPLVEGAIDMGRNFLGMEKIKRSDEGFSARKAKETQFDTRMEAKDLFDKTKKTYSSIYNDMMKNGVINPNTGQRVKGTDELFLRFVSGIERNNAVKKNIMYGMDDPEVFEKIINKAIESPSSKTFIEMKKDGSDGDAIAKDEVIKSMSDSKTSTKKQILINDDGDMFVQVGDKNLKINREVLPVQLKTDKASLKMIKDGLYNYRLTDKQMQEIADTDFDFGGISVRVNIDPRNPQMKRQLIVSDANSPYQEIILDSPAQLQSYIANQIYKSASYENKVKPVEQ